MDKPLIKLGELADKNPQAYKFYITLVSILWQELKENPEDSELQSMLSNMPENEQMIALMDLIDRGYIAVFTEDNKEFSLEVTPSGRQMLGEEENV